MAVVTGLGFYTILAITGWLQGPHKTIPAARHGKYSCPRHRSLQISAKVSISSAFITQVTVLALAPSIPVSVLVLTGTAQFSPGWDEQEEEHTKSWVSHICFWLERRIFYTHPHSSIPATTLIKIISSQRTGHMSVLKTALAASVQRHTSWFTSPDWNYPEKKKCTFLTLDTWAEERAARADWKYSPSEELMEYIYTALLSEVEQKGNFWQNNKQSFLDRKKANHTHPPKPFILNNLSIVTVENGLQLGFGFSFCPFCKDTPHPADSAQPLGCCCLPSYQVQEGIATLANSELSLKASAQHAFVTLWQALAVSKMCLQTMRG